MAEFRRLYQKDLLDHSPVAHTDQVESARGRSALRSGCLVPTTSRSVTASTTMAWTSESCRRNPGIVLLLLYLALDDSDNRPLVIDQPEENLDPKSVFDELVQLFIDAKAHRQVIMVTHNANLVINTDADQIIIAESGPHPHGALPPITYKSAGLRTPISGKRYATSWRARRCFSGACPTSSRQTRTLVKVANAGPSELVPQIETRQQMKTDLCETSFSVTIHAARRAGAPSRQKGGMTIECRDKTNEA